MTRNAWIFAAALGFALNTFAADDGKAIYEGGCIACHGTGVLGAPKAGDADAWKPRATAGLPGLLASAKAGKGAMPAKGGNPALSDAQLASAISFMSGIGGAAVATAPSTVNSFNRLLRPPAQRNRAPAEDGIHDAANDGTLALQPPLAAFNDLVRSNAGNRVDWVKSLRESRITPRADKVDAKVAPMVMDLNIVREVKGSMPDVVYPHKQHTEWLDCSNCHPAIFKPQKGANQISMASILLGQQCGVCHGKVAFPVSECRLCHSKAKTLPVTAGASPHETAPVQK
jgi:c(7)-type cytochrome triheme protein